MSKSLATLVLRKIHLQLMQMRCLKINVWLLGGPDVLLVVSFQTSNMLHNHMTHVFVPVGEKPVFVCSFQYTYTDHIDL